jgi:hypothetical protein
MIQSIRKRRPSVLEGEWVGEMGGKTHFPDARIGLKRIGTDSYPDYDSSRQADRPDMTAAVPLTSSHLCLSCLSELEKRNFSYI